MGIYLEFAYSSPRVHIYVLLNILLGTCKLTNTPHSTLIHVW